MQEQLTRWRRALHAIPEIGLELPKTQAYLMRELGGVGAKLEAVAGYGLALFFDLGFGDALAFRADMDALVIGEENDVPYRSTHAGHMHACGHDAHMAMLLAFAHWVDAHRQEMKHNVLLLFQPGEECWGGGQIMADTGILEAHNVIRVFALHVDTHLAVGQVGSRPGAFMARPSNVRLTVHGKSSHIARAAEGIDAMAAGISFYRRATDWVDAFDSRDPKALKFGLLRAGSAPNIIADELALSGTMRTFAQQDFDAIKRALMDIASDVAQKTGARMHLEIEDGFPPVINDEALYARAVGALSGMNYLEISEPVLMGEDFSCFLQRVPGVMLYIGVGDVPPLHSPTFDFDERALMTGVEVFQRLCLMK